MKKVLIVFLVLILLLAPSAALVSCSSAEDGLPIVFGKKYMQSETDYYVFRADKTGYREYYYAYEDSYDPADNYIISGRVDFVWRETSNGAVHIFVTDTHYNDDHTEGKSIPFCEGALTFGEEFFTYMHSNQFGDSARYYILEGSALDKVLDA